MIDTKGAGHAQKSEGTVTTDSKGVQEYNPVACTGLSTYPKSRKTMM